jgi:hypothetical protein
VRARAPLALRVQVSHALSIDIYIYLYLWLRLHQPSAAAPVWRGAYLHICSRSASMPIYISLCVPGGPDGIPTSTATTEARRVHAVGMRVPSSRRNAHPISDAGTEPPSPYLEVLTRQQVHSQGRDRRLRVLGGRVRTAMYSQGTRGVLTGYAPPRTRRVLAGYSRGTRRHVLAGYSRGTHGERAATYSQGTHGVRATTLRNSSAGPPKRIAAHARTRALTREYA